MPGDDYGKISIELREAGLERLAEEPPLPSPTLIVIGAAARQPAERTALLAQLTTGPNVRVYC